MAKESGPPRRLGGPLRAGAWYGRRVVGDFTPGVDRLLVTADLGLADFAAVAARFAVLSPTQSWINLGQGDFVILNGVQSLSAGDVVFA
jgi:hypothetical protein